MTYTLDKLDLTLVTELESDARQSAPELAAKAGTSATTVRRRLQRLLDKRIVTIVARADPQALGYTLRTVLAVNALPGKASLVADRLASIRNVEAVLMTSGRYGILAYGLFRSTAEDLLEFVSRDLSRIPEIAEIETLLTLKVVKSSWAFLGVDDRGIRNDPPPRVLDRSELALIEALETDPRATSIELAERIGINRNLVSRKLQALLDEGFIRVVSSLAPSVLGYNTAIAMLVKVRPGASSVDVADALARYRNIKHVFVTVGHFDVYAWGIFRDIREMHGFVDSELGTIEGVMRFEILVHIKLRKATSPLLASPSE